MLHLPLRLCFPAASSDRGDVGFFSFCQGYSAMQHQAGQHRGCEVMKYLSPERLVIVRITQTFRGLSSGSISSRSSSGRNDRNRILDTVTSF